MNIPENVLEAYKRYEKIADKYSFVDGNSDQTTYKKAQRAINGAYRKFEKECVKEGLSHISVSRELISTTIKSYI